MHADLELIVSRVEFESMNERIEDVRVNGRGVDVILAVSKIVAVDNNILH